MNFKPLPWCRLPIAYSSFPQRRNPDIGLMAALSPNFGSDIHPFHITRECRQEEHVTRH